MSFIIITHFYSYFNSIHQPLQTKILVDNNLGDKGGDRNIDWEGDGGWTRDGYQADKADSNKGGHRKRIDEGYYFTSAMYQT